MKKTTSNKTDKALTRTSIDRRRFLSQASVATIGCSAMASAQNIDDATLEPEHFRELIGSDFMVKNDNGAIPVTLVDMNVINDPNRLKHFRRKKSFSLVFQPNGNATVEDGFGVLHSKQLGETRLRFLPFGPENLIQVCFS